MASSEKSVIGILKPSGSLHSNEAETAPKKKLQINSKSGIRWDEVVIAEHDKARGTRRKINEPNTPYYSFSGGGASGSLPSATEEASDDNAEARDIGEENSSRAQTADLQKTVNAEELRQRLQELQDRNSFQDTGSDNGRLCHSSSAGSSFSIGLVDTDKSLDQFETGSDEDQSRRKNAFAERRKLHYDEFRVIRKLRMSGSISLASDEEDNRHDGDMRSIEHLGDQETTVQSISDDDNTDSTKSKSQER